MDLAALRTDLSAIKLEDNPQILKQKSRDFYWYSPVLKRQLDHVVGDLVATPRNEDEL
ncbi:MAG: FAD-binding protein, partial [Pseudomonadota bacterium]